MVAQQGLQLVEELPVDAARLVARLVQVQQQEEPQPVLHPVGGRVSGVSGVTECSRVSSVSGVSRVS